MICSLQGTAVCWRMMIQELQEISTLLLMVYVNYFCGPVLVICSKWLCVDLESVFDVSLVKEQNLVIRQLLFLWKVKNLFLCCFFHGKNR